MAFSELPLNSELKKSIVHASKEAVASLMQTPADGNLPRRPQKLSKTLSPRGGTCRGLQELEIDCMRSDARQKHLARLRNQVDRIKDELRLKEESK